VVDWGGSVLAGCRHGSNPLARAMDRPHSAAASLALADQLPLPRL